MDLSPGYRELRPPAALRDALACLWVRVSDAEHDVRVVPDACADVVWRQGHGVTIVGPDTGAKLTPTGPSEVIVGLRFRPGAGGGGLGVPLDELTDLSADAADVDAAFDLDPELAPDDVVARFLAVAAERPGDPLVQHAAACLGRGRPLDVGLSERQLRRRFHAAVGYGPKTLERILRFRRALDAIDAGQDDLAAIALDAGYADQAHFTRECTKLAGLSPARLRRARAARPPAAGTAARRTR